MKHFRSLQRRHSIETLARPCHIARVPLRERSSRDGSRRGPSAQARFGHTQAHDSASTHQSPFGPSSFRSQAEPTRHPSLPDLTLWFKTFPVPSTPLLRAVGGRRERHHGGRRRVGLGRDSFDVPELPGEDAAPQRVRAREVRQILSFIASFGSGASWTLRRTPRAFRSSCATTEGAFRGHPAWRGASDDELDASGEGLEKYLSDEAVIRARSR